LFLFLQKGNGNDSYRLTIDEWGIVMSQLMFKLPEIDREQTKEAVEAALEKYRFYLLSLPDEKLPKVTATFSLVPPSFTNGF
jgi:hypothetical protein